MLLFTCYVVVCVTVVFSSFGWVASFEQRYEKTCSRDKVSPQTTIKLFADDCLLYRTIDSAADANQL